MSEQRAIAMLEKQSEHQVWEKRLSERALVLRVHLVVWFVGVVRIVESSRRR